MVVDLKDYQQDFVDAFRMEFSKEDIKCNFVVFWTDEYGEDMLEVYKPANKIALDNIYNIITMEEAPEIENLFNIGHYSFCFARPLNR